MRARVAALALALTVLVLTSPAWADAGSEVTVHAVLSPTNAPVAGARVTLIGSSAGLVFSASTDARGDAFIHGVPPGIYRVEIRSQAYQTLVERIETRAGKIAQLEAALAPLKSIATVRSRSTRLAFVDIVGERSALRKFSPNLVEALQNLGGVEVRQVNGMGALLSIRGQDSSETKYEINGVALAGSGAGASVNTDLLAQASVDQRNDLVSFLYLSPTLQPHYTAQLSSGGFGSNVEKVTLQGTSGAVGLAFAHAHRRQDSLLEGQTYADLSGTNYQHHGNLTTDGDYLKFSAPLGQWVAGVQGDISRSTTLPIPTYYAGTVPAGYGPGEIVSSHNSNFIGSANGSVGRRGAGASISASSWSSDTTDDARTRVIAGLRFPMLARSHSSGYTEGVSVGAATPYFRQQVTLTHQFSSQISTVRLGNAAPNSSQFAYNSNQLLFDLSHGNQDRRFEASLTATQTPQKGASFEFRPSLQFKPRPDDTVTVSASAGGITVLEDAITQQLIDPAAASYDCTGKTISIEGPGDTSASPRSVGLNLAWMHQAKRAQFGVIAYATSVRNSMLTGALVPLSREPPGYVSPAFLALLRAGYGSTGACPGAVPDSDKTFFLENVAGLSALYSGGTVTYSRTLSSVASLELGATLTGARITALDQRLTGNYSPYVIGGQMPNVPPLTFTATFDTLLDRHGTELLVHLQHSSQNNDRNLPGFSQYSAGLVRSLGTNSSLSLIATNMANAFSGAFVSPRNAIALPTSNGGIFPTVASPLRPPTIYLQLTIKRLPADEGF